MRHNNWSDLLLAATSKAVAAIKADDHYWRYNLKVEKAPVTRGNINQLFAQNGLAGDIGLLSIGAGGMEYWLWEACTQVAPRIQVVDYNPVFGHNTRVTVPYHASFERCTMHWSCDYARASIGALAQLGTRKGYSLVGGNRVGSAAFFVRDDCIGELAVKSAQQAFAGARIRATRDRWGERTLRPIGESLKALHALPVIDLASGDRRAIGDLEPRYD